MRGILGFGLGLGELCCCVGWVMGVVCSLVAVLFSADLVLFAVFPLRFVVEMMYSFLSFTCRRIAHPVVGHEK